MSDDPTAFLGPSCNPQALRGRPYNYGGNNDYAMINIFTPANDHDSLGQTFTFASGDSNFSSSPSSTYSSPAFDSLGDSFPISGDECSPLSPNPSELGSWSQDPHFLSVPPLTRRRSHSGGSSNHDIDSSTAARYPGLRRHNSASSLAMGRNNQQILDISQNVGSMSLEDNRPYHNAGTLGGGGPALSLSTVPSLYGGTALIIPIQTPSPDELPYYWSPAPSPGSSSPISQSSSLTPIDAMAGNDNVNMAGTRSMKSIRASLNRRKRSGPGKFVCHICQDDFTTKHRLKGHVASKHEGKKLTCPSCKMVLSHGTSYERHLKRTCPVLYPRDRRT
ncbi:hypothetical protein IW261DRAFT_1476494 [Armillaria novae-zelandiae]|uniref:C2H2-type domain-containing protein n=1 Tax=Armillaria novae-zelandiae TaxID=153914 RepID=A0AA39UFE1_9AGAR|nr:hypothetical protein IW261DRAFT_1476494 [Armillaria novae-zelandiae]